MSQANNTALNALIRDGKALDGFEQFYADEISMQENSAPATVGKDANRVRELEFFGSIGKVNRFEQGLTAYEGDVAFSEWHLDVEFNNGFHMKTTQVSRRVWKDGKVVEERFYYSAG